VSVGADVESKLPEKEVESVALTVLMFPTVIEIVLDAERGTVESIAPVLSAVQPRIRSPVA
jgi:hypothetical protein